MNFSRTSAAFILATFSATAVQAQAGLTAVPRTQADAIICPIQQITYGLAMNLPDPWTQTLQTDSRPWNDAGTYGPYTVMVNGKEYLACRWKPDKEPFRYKIRRPATDTPPETWPCPAQVNARIVSPIPSPWVGTTYPATLVSKTQGTLLGVPQNYCEYDGTVPGAILYQMPVTAIPTVGGLAANPRTIPTPDNLAQVFMVTKAQLRAIPQKASMSCPATVRFEGRIAANGPGQVRYRQVINNQASVHTLNFAAGGEKVVKFETQAEVAQQPAAGISLAAAGAPTNVVKGSARLVIESPQGVGESNMAAYEITCTPLAGASNLAQTPPPPPPAPQTLVAPTPQSDPAPTALAAPPTASQPPAEGAARTVTGRAAPTRAVAGAALPDLRIAASELNRARPNMVRLQIVNSGAAASAATRVRVSLPDGKAWYGAVPALAPGQELWVVVRADMSLLEAAEIHARVDEPNRVRESDENNDHKVK